MIDCSTCEHKKGMINKRRGVKIPGQSGKCTRKGGLCGRFLIGMVQGGTPQAEIMAAFGFKNSSAMRVAYANALMAEPRLKENQQKKDVDMKSSLTTSTEPLVPEVVEEGGVGALTEREAARLEALERRIDTNARAFMDVGAALAEIREARLYRQTHGTFEEYVRQRWEFSRARAYQLVDSSAAARNVNNCGHGIVPANEAQARPLALLAESDQVEVWDRVVETAQDGKITAKAVAAAVAEHLGKKKSQKARTIRDGATTDPELPEDLRAYVAGLVDKVRGLTEKAHRAAMLKYLDGLRNLLQD